METFSDIYGYVSILVIAFCVIQFFDIIFRTCLFYPYLIMMNNSGIIIKPYMIVWRITKFNETFRKMGHCMPSLLKKWFNTGFYLSFISMFVALGLLINPIFHHFFSQLPSSNSDNSNNNYNNSNNKDIVVSVIPGITTPFSHVVYIIPALLVSVVFHEFGHALAGSREKVPVESCGLALALIIPAAFVSLDYRKLSICTSKQQLRVYCAGVWHNIVLLFLSLLFVNYAPSVLSPYYQTGVGVTVLNVQKPSTLANTGGFTKGDVITSINSCEVRDLETWLGCLAETSSTPQLGFCSSMKFIQKYGNISECCTSSIHDLCFKLFTNEIDDFVCLPARETIDRGTFCRNNYDCLEKVCLQPFLSSKEEKVIKVKRNNQNSVLFIGFIEEFFSVRVSSWVSDMEFPSISLMTDLENFFKYLAGISGGLIIMNIVPCYFLDGGHIIEHLLDYIDKHFKLKLRSGRKAYITKVFKIVGLLLLVSNILLGLKNLKIIKV